MKYADGLWLNKPGYGVNYATQMYEVTADETSVNVLATNQWIGNRGMTLGGPVLEITFTSTLENTIKVSIDHYKGRVHKSPDFQLNEDKPGLGKKGDYVALEVNMRPAGGYTPDMINYANSVDCYQIWADMVCYDEVRNAELDGPKYFCVYAGRRDCHEYKHTHAQIMAKYGSRMKMAERIPQALRLDMGDQMYTAVVRSTAERDAFIRYVQEKA